MRIGLLGYGYMGTIRHRVLAERADCTVSRIFHTQAIDGFDRDTDWTHVVDDPDVDAVVVCLPNHLTREATCRALANGKHVFAEKPPGRTVAEIEAMAGAERESGRVLQFGFNHRHHPAFVALQQRAQTVGPIRWVRGVYGKPREPDFDAGWRADVGLAGGGILLDQGIHMLDLMRSLCGDVDVVHAVALDAPRETEVMAVLRFASGAVGSVHSSQSQWPPTFSLTVGLAGGVLVMEGLLSRSGRYGPEQLHWRDHTGLTDTVSFDVDDSWARELDLFLRAARGECAVTVGSTSEALDLMRLLERIYGEAADGLH